MRNLNFFKDARPSNVLSVLLITSHPHVSACFSQFPQYITFATEKEEHLPIPVQRWLWEVAVITEMEKDHTLLVVDSSHHMVGEAAAWWEGCPSLLFSYTGDREIKDLNEILQQSLNEPVPENLKPDLLKRMVENINNGIPPYTLAELDEVRQRQEQTQTILSIKEQQHQRALKRKEDAKKRAEDHAKEPERPRKKREKGKKESKKRTERLELAAAVPAEEEEESLEGTASEREPTRPPPKPPAAPRRTTAGLPKPRPDKPAQGMARKTLPLPPIRDRSPSEPRRPEAQESSSSRDPPAASAPRPPAPQPTASQKERIRRLSETLPFIESSDEDEPPGLPRRVRSPEPRQSSREPATARRRLDAPTIGTSPAEMLRKRLSDAKSSSRSPSVGRPPQ